MIENGLKLIFDGLKGDLFRPEAPPENWASWYAFHPNYTQQNGGVALNLTLQVICIFKHYCFETYDMGHFSFELWLAYTHTHQIM